MTEVLSEFDVLMSDLELTCDTPNDERPARWVLHGSCGCFGLVCEECKAWTIEAEAHGAVNMCPHHGALVSIRWEKL